MPLSDDETTRLFTASYARVLAPTCRGQRFFDAFYARFMATSPEVRRKFLHTDMARQKEIVEQSLYHMLDYHVTRTPSDYLRHLAVVHGKAGHDIGPEFYALWLDALLATVREFDDQYSESIAAAWRRVLSDGIGFMLERYDG